MKNKPWPFIVLAILHFIEPLVKIAYFKFSTNFTFATIISNVSEIATMKELFEFWLLFPLAGMALLGMKRWSYPLFVGAQMYSVYSHITYQSYNWPYVSKVPFVSSLVLLTLNIMLIIYFAMPSVREPFFNKALRWWETKTRFNKSLACALITDQNKAFNVEILNISETGAFVNLKEVLPLGTYVTINFAYKDHRISVRSEVKAHHTFDQQKGCGLKFDFENIWEDLALRRVVKAIGKDVKKEQVEVNFARPA